MDAGKLKKVDCILLNVAANHVTFLKFQFSLFAIMLSFKWSNKFDVGLSKMYKCVQCSVNYQDYFASKIKKIIKCYKNSNSQFIFDPAHFITSVFLH